MIIVDASVLIAHFNANDALHERAVTALLTTEDDPLYASSVTIAEVLVGPARSGWLDEGLDALEALAVEEVAFGQDAAKSLAAMRASTGLKLPDCSVLLAAQDSASEVVLTFDEKLAAEATRLGFATAVSDTAHSGA